MRRTRIAGILAAALLAGAGAVAAQNIVVEAHVPLAFVVENTTLPMGDYVVERASPDQASPLVIRSRDGKTSVAFLSLELPSKGAKPAAQTELVFEELGGKSYLNEIWYGGELTGAQVVKSRSFEEAMKKANGISKHKSVKASTST